MLVLVLLLLYVVAGDTYPMFFQLNQDAVLCVKDRFVVSYRFSLL